MGPSLFSDGDRPPPKSRTGLDLRTGLRGLPRNRGSETELREALFLTGCQRTSYDRERSRGFCDHQTARIESSDKKDQRTIGRVELGSSRGTPQY